MATTTTEELKNILKEAEQNSLTELDLSGQDPAVITLMSAYVPDENPRRNPRMN